MTSSRKVRQVSADLIPLLQSRFLPVLQSHPAHVALWLPLYRTPSPNRMRGEHWSSLVKRKAEAYHQLYGAQMSTSPYTGSDFLTGITSGPP